MRLIDADALEKKCFKLQKFGNGRFLALGNIRTAPTIDAVPVIRCADCKYSFVVTHLDGRRQLSCTEIGKRNLKDNDFCSYGKLRK